jgi:asparagine synthase (glutamine-hydrolysing)
MCGIVGFLSKSLNSRKDIERVICNMSRKVKHRGPDGSGNWLDVSNGMALGHQRLSILDLSQAGRQPMTSSCRRYTLVFNGEIYNHLKLRKMLEAGGSINWVGHSDTETLVSAFAQWGIEKTLEKLVGMFSIALWDSKEKKLSLIRDRFGEKPLYYGWSNGDFIFGSELKPLRVYHNFCNSIDRNVLSLYMRYMYVPSPYSIFKDIYKLEPGCMLQIDSSLLYLPPKEPPFSPFKSTNVNITQWYSPHGDKLLFKKEDEAIHDLEKSLLESVSLQMISDVPLGVFLSGGIDSSTIAALMQNISKDPIKTFTIGFEDSSFNEAKYANKIAAHLGTDHHELYVTSEDAHKVIPKLPDIYDEPFADSSQIPTYLVSKLAHSHVKVALSGDGGDELFGGYNRYLWADNIWKKLKYVPPSMRKKLGTIIQKIPISVWNEIGPILPNKYQVASMGAKAHKLAQRLKTVNSLNDMYQSLVTEYYKEKDVVIHDGLILKTKLDKCSIDSKVGNPEQQMMVCDSLTYLPDDILTKVDRAAMSVGLETRIPFLDHRVVDLSRKIPIDMKIKDGNGKWILRQVLYKYIPQELIDRPKTGFSIPIGQWLRGPLRTWAEDLLDESKIRQDGYLDSELVLKLWRQHIDKKYDWSSRLWAILMFQVWLRDFNSSSIANNQ